MIKRYDFHFVEYLRKDDYAYAMQLPLFWQLLWGLMQYVQAETVVDAVAKELRISMRVPEVYFPDPDAAGQPKTWNPTYLEHINIGIDLRRTVPLLMYQKPPTQSLAVMVSEFFHKRFTGKVVGSFILENVRLVNFMVAPKQNGHFEDWHVTLQFKYEARNSNSSLFNDIIRTYHRTDFFDPQVAGTLHRDELNEHRLIEDIWKGDEILAELCKHPPLKSVHTVGKLFTWWAEGHLEHLDKQVKFYLITHFGGRPYTKSTAVDIATMKNKESKS